MTMSGMSTMSSMPSMSSATSMASMAASTTQSAMQATHTAAPTMPMVFSTQNLHSVLFSYMWKIDTPGAYAASFIFLFLLTVIWRGLNLMMKRLDEFWAAKLRSVHNAAQLSDSTSHLEKRHHHRMSFHAGRLWRVSIQVPRAMLSTVIQGIAYLLMISVMSMNVGFFMAVLLGFFVGEVAFARLGIEVHASL